MPPEPAAAPAPLLEARALTKRFDALVALDAVSLAVAPGTVTAILGPSGSGKSTLLRCLNFLVLPDTGEVRCDGALVDPRHDAALNAHRARVGMVFQQFNLFPHLRVWENLAPPSPAPSPSSPPCCFSMNPRVRSTPSSPAKSSPSCANSPPITRRWSW
jgi:polar amino acid transport system ATP-binding protein